MSNWYSYKKPVYAVITLMNGEEEVGTFFATEYNLGKALDETTGLDLYDWDQEFKSEDGFKLPHGKNSIPWLLIEEKDVPTRITKKRHVACCAFNATSDFMVHHLSAKLDHYDKDWYEAHHLVTQHGLPQKHSFTVIQQLVEPYDLGIKSITIPRNSQRFDEYKPFMLALGTNPFFAVDGRTTNEEALERLFPNEEMRNKNRDRMLAQWRFECTDQPYKGAIVMKMISGGRSMAGDHNGGSSYEGPRSPNRNAGEWVMSIKLGRLENITYKKPIELPEYKEFDGAVEFDWWKIVDPASGKTIRQLENERSKSSWKKSSNPKPVTRRSRSESQKETPNAGTGGTTEGDSEKAGDLVWAYPSDCEVCNKDTTQTKAFANAARACPHCFTELRKVQVSPSKIGDGYMEAEPDRKTYRSDHEYWEDWGNY